MSTSTNGNSMPSASDVAALQGQALNGNAAGFAMPSTSTNQLGFTTGVGSPQQLPTTLGGLSAPDYTSAALGNSTGILNNNSGGLAALGKAATQLKAPSASTQSMPNAVRAGGVRLPAEQFSSDVSGAPLVNGSQGGLSLLQLMQQLKA